MSRIVAEDRRGLLQMTVGENNGEKGPYQSAVLRRSYQDQSGQWKETKVSLPLRDLLQAARMLQWANDCAYEAIRSAKERRQDHADDGSPSAADSHSAAATAPGTFNAQVTAASGPDADIPF